MAFLFTLASGSAAADDDLTKKVEDVADALGEIVARADTTPIPTNTNARFRLYPTRNIFNQILLDTASGMAWQVMFATKEEHSEGKVLIIDKPLVGKGQHPGRFTLYPTKNIYSFFLVDQDDGRIWKLQWGIGPEFRFYKAITDIDFSP